MLGLNFAWLYKEGKGIATNYIELGHDAKYQMVPNFFPNLGLLLYTLVINLLIKNENINISFGWKEKKWERRKINLMVIEL